MVTSMIRSIAMGSKSPEELFKQYWEAHGFQKVNSGDGSILTVPVQRMLHTSNKDLLKQNKGMVRRAIVKQMTAAQVATHTPLIFDPEILSILSQNAPFKERIAIEGQQGFKAVFNLINSRAAPLGFKAESAVLDLSGSSGSGIGFDKGEIDMRIYVDLVDISDFTQAAAEHYMNVADTTLGERVALYAQRSEQQMLYGDPTEDTQTGYLGDATGYAGLAKIFADAGNSVDKRGVSENFIQDIKREIHQLLQEAKNVNINDLLIVTSWSFFDVLANELVPAQTRLSAVSTEADIGIQTLRIQGVPVIATHNVATHVDSGFVTGDEGDVFIVNTRATRFRSLVPFSTIPLGRLGLSERTALFEFGAMIERTKGAWGKHLKAYDFEETS
jgi:hypothetical protein